MSYFLATTNCAIPPLSEMFGGENWTVTDQLASAAGGGYRGNTAGFTIAVICQINTQVSGAYLLDYIDGTGKGYSLWQNNATQVEFRTGNLAGDGFFASAHYEPADDLGKIQLLVMTHTGVNGEIFLWANDLLVGGGVTVDGYSLPNIALRQTIGARGNGTAAHTGATIFGWGAWDAALTNDQIHLLYDAVRSTGKLPATLDNTAMIHNVVNDVTGASFPATITDEVGNENFTFVTGSAAAITLSEVTALSFWPVQPSEPLRVFAGLGDSDMAGRSLISNAPPGYPPGASVLMLKDIPTGWETLLDPTADGTPPNGVSPLGLFGWIYQQSTGVTTGVINTALGSQRTSNFLPNTPAFATLKGKIQVGLSRRGAELYGFLSYIGPNDALDAPPAVWDANWTAILTELRLRLNAPTLPEAVVQLPPTIPGVGGPYLSWNEVRADIVTYTQAAPERLFIAAVDGPYVDGLHLDTSANYVVAQQCLAAINP